MNVKKAVGVIALLALGAGLTGCSEGTLLYKGKKGNKEITYWVTMEKRLKEEAKGKHMLEGFEYNGGGLSTLLIIPYFYWAKGKHMLEDFEYKPAYLMEINLNGDIYRVRDLNMDGRIMHEDDDKLAFTPKYGYTQLYDNSTYTGKLMLKEADKLYQETLAEIKEDICSKQ